MRPVVHEAEECPKSAHPGRIRNGTRILGSRAQPTPSPHFHSIASACFPLSFGTAVLRMVLKSGGREYISTLYLLDKHDFLYANKHESKQTLE